jgi:hypothetical protein
VFYAHWIVDKSVRSEPRHHLGIAVFKNRDGTDRPYLTIENFANDDAFALLEVAYQNSDWGSTGSVSSGPSFFTEPTAVPTP